MSTAVAAYTPTASIAIFGTPQDFEIVYQRPADAGAATTGNPAAAGTAVAAKIPPVPSEDEAQFADDYPAHKIENVWQLCVERGYVLIVHGGGTTFLWLKRQTPT